jgi:hypothetical protein
MTLRARLVSAIVVLAIAVLLLVLALIDPLEGGIALLVGIVLLVVVLSLSRVAVPKLLWISVALAVALGATILSLVIFATPAAPVDGAVANPLNGSVIGLLWVYRVAVLCAVAGAVQYLVRLVRTARAPV